MTAGFIFIMGLFFLWIAFTNRGRGLMEAITGMKWVDPHSSSSGTAN
jgi:hypothetical protein